MSNKKPLNFPSPIITTRLLIRPLNIEDDKFILELVNTEGWIKFIGNRNIASPADARAYIQKILDNENIFYWVVQSKEQEESMGLITFIKRDYLEHHDIGFAFLPRFFNKGYAYEATMAVLQTLIDELNPPHILATTIPENESSIKLLKKIGLAFEKEIALKDSFGKAEKERLHVYGMSMIN